MKKNFNTGLGKSVEADRVKLPGGAGRYFGNSAFPKSLTPQNWQSECWCR